MSAQAEPSASASAAPLEGPASQPHRYPDGLTVTLTKVERVPNGWGADVPTSQAIVRLTLDVANGTADALPVEPMTREMTLLHGPNRQEAGQVTGYSYPDPVEEKQKALTLDGGTRIPAGGKATFVESGLVPVAALGDLTVVVELPAADGIRDPFTLTEVEGLLRTVK